MPQERTIPIPLSDCTLEQYRARPNKHPTPPPLNLDFIDLLDEKPGIEEKANIILLGAVCVIGTIFLFYSNE